MITGQTDGDGRTCAGSQGPGSGVCNTVGQTLARPAGHLASPSPFLWSTGNLCNKEERRLHKFVDTANIHANVDTSLDRHYQVLFNKHRCISGFDMSVLFSVNNENNRGQKN